MIVGDPIRRVPSFGNELTSLDAKKTLQGRVIYIHPERRYYTVELTTDKGHTIRESYYFPGRGNACD